MKKILILTILGLASFCTKAQHQHHQQKAIIPVDVEKLLQKYACLACHKVDAKLIGPAYMDVSKKKYTAAQIVELIYNPRPANWPGFPPMSPMKHVPEAEALKIAKWISGLSNKKVG